MEDPVQTDDEVSAAQLGARDRHIPMNRHEAETVQFVALVNSRHPVLAMLLALGRSPVKIIVLTLAGAAILGGQDGRLALLAGLVKAL